MMTVNQEMTHGSLFETPLRQALLNDGLLAVVTVEEVGQAEPLARALLAGGVSIIELAWRTEAALGAVRAIRAAVPELCVGMGTLLEARQVVEALEAGAAFGVSPGFSPEMLEAAADAGLPYAPGVMTPSEIQQAVARGCQLLKFFPAESSGGLGHLKSMNAPFAHLGLRYIVLGGLDESNAGAYLAEPCVGMLGGSWIAPPALIRRKAWDEISARAARAREMVTAARGGKYP